MITRPAERFVHLYASDYFHFSLASYSMSKGGIFVVAISANGFEHTQVRCQWNRFGNRRPRFSKKVTGKCGHNYEFPPVYHLLAELK